VVLGVESNRELRELFGGGRALDGADFDRALRILRSPHLLDRARALATEQVEVARGLLNQLKPSIYRDSLRVLIDEQIDREV
jgi:geranylgeranyl pyrophosphate synthase